ncbi:putative nucleotidyltransferase [Brevundimonas vesicularis]|uniref:Putative nucleotidyltransferase n=1 Tax=Brevundimonas vesicularis TaxID=41276 RepID=A0A7W9FS86_BREVE|nr:DNA processing protein DprA [Brevundimonas vesicularis]MBB5770625.1 putative nucleotidyltransferase [Brevundimonas vesicularis]
MRRDDALAGLRSLETFLRGRGVSQIYLFGSVARDEAAPGSIVGVAFDIAPGSDFDAFDQGGLYLDLVDALGTQVNFIERRNLRTTSKIGVEVDLIRVF